MYYYRIYGLYVVSDLEIPEAETVDDLEEGDLVIKKDILSETRNQSGGICLVVYNKSKASIQLGSGGTLLIQNGVQILYNEEALLDTKLLRESILGDGFGQAMYQRGDYMIHGSAVIYHNKVLMITGISGAGKSTLTLELLHQRAIFMADDTVAIRLDNQIAYAYPGYPQQKLCEDAAIAYGYHISDLIPISEERSKYAISMISNYHSTRKVADILIGVEVGDVESVQILEIVGSEKLKFLLDASYVYKVYKKFAIPYSEMLKCISIANQIKMYKLIRPRTGNTVVQQAAVINEMLCNNL